MLSVERLRELLDYNPDTGVFVWRDARRGLQAGAIAGSLTDSGYRIICIDKERVRAHRLAWLWVHGRMPNGFLDHINGKRDDNRIANLREATIAQNSWNSRVAKGAAGLRGVVYDSERGKYRGRLKVNGRLYVTGRYNTAEEASAMRESMAQELHGEFYRRVS